MRAFWATREQDVQKPASLSTHVPSNNWQDFLTAGSAGVGQAVRPDLISELQAVMVGRLGGGLELRPGRLCKMQS